MRLLWSRDARDDLLTIADYYHEIDPDLAEAMLDRVANAAYPLLDHPRIGPVFRHDVRKWLVRGTPFLLFYVLRDDAIEIRAVRHAASNLRLF